MDSPTDIRTSVFYKCFSDISNISLIVYHSPEVVLVDRWRRPSNLTSVIEDRLSVFLLVLH
jgi:hypothetical protein